jgi:hypothetical protein
VRVEAQGRSCEVCWCVSIRSPSPHIYRCAQGCLDRQMRCIHLEPTLRCNREAPRGRSKAVGLLLVRPNQPGYQATSASSERLASGPRGLWCATWRYPKAVACPGGHFDPCEAERCILIGRRLLPWIEGCVSLLLRCIFSLIDLHINIYQHLWNLLVITPTTSVDACLSGVYAGVDA